MKKPNNHLESLFFIGRYQEVLAGLKASPETQYVPILIGALSFTGRAEEARSLFELRSKSLDLDQQVMARFFLILGLVRISSYREAREHIANNLRATRETSSLRSRFYAYQGLAFYRYFCGRWESGLKAATTSFEAALEDGFSYGKILSADLRGHLLAQVSNVDEGIRYLKEAQSLALEAGNTSVSEAAEISVLSYQAQYGIKPQSIISRLEKKLVSLEATDTYSKTALLLEMARQLTLRGRLPEVKPYLDQAAHLAYMFKNRRQEATLNLRLAYLRFVQGDYYQALSFTSAAERCLDLQVDRGLLLASLGLQLQIVTQLGIPEREEQLRHALKLMSQHHGSMSHSRMLRRTHSDFKSVSLTGRGDRIGEMRDAGQVNDLITAGTLQLLYDIKGWRRDERAIAFDVTPGTHVVLDKGRIHTFTELTSLTRKTLLALLQGAATKKQLIEKVWGYAYDPLRHDPLVYNAITGLRRALGASGSWVETTDEGYRLPADVRTIIESVPLKPNTTKSSIAESSGLNSRQLSFLKKLKTGEFAHVKSYQKIFQVSEITACRDLAMLFQQGYLIRVGRARATRYALPGDFT